MYEGYFTGSFFAAQFNVLPVFGTNGIVINVRTAEDNLLCSLVLYNILH